MRRQRTPDGTIDEAWFTLWAFGWQALQELPPGTPGLGHENIIEAIINDVFARALWQQHRETVLQEATRRGIARPITAEVQFDDGADAAT